MTEKSLFLNPICRIRPENWNQRKNVYDLAVFGERGANGDNRRDSNPDPQFTCMNFMYCHHIYKCPLSMGLSSTSLTTSSHLA